MAYDKQTWVNGVAGGTPINASRLQHIEDGLLATSLVADAAETPAETAAAIAAQHTADNATYLTVVEAPLSPSRYGVKSDGVTDDSAAWANVFSAIPVAGGDIYLDGWSLLSSGISVPSSGKIRLKGKGKKSVGFKANADSIALLTYNGTSGVPCTYNELESIGFDANGHTGVVGIHGSYWNLSTVSDIYANQLDWVITTNFLAYTHIDRIISDEINNGVSFFGATNAVLSDTSLHGVGAGIGLHVDSHCDGAEFQNVNVDGIGTGYLQENSAGGTNYPLSTILNNVQCGGGSGDGFQIYAGYGTALANCLAVTMAGFGMRFRVPGFQASKCSSRNNGKNGVFIDTGGGALGNFSWHGGEIIGNGTANVNTWEGFSVGNGTVNFRVLGIVLGAYGAYANTQTYGLVVGTGCDFYTLRDNGYGTNISGGLADLSSGTATHRTVDGNW